MRLGTVVREISQKKLAREKLSRKTCSPMRGFKHTYGFPGNV
jgi:hypothetical protein